MDQSLMEINSHDQQAKETPLRKKRSLKNGGLQQQEEASEFF